MLDETGVPTPEVVTTQTVDVVAAPVAPKKRGRKQEDWSPYLEKGETLETVTQDTLWKRKSRGEARTKKSAEDAKYNSKIIPTKAEAKEYLRTRIVNEHVVDTCHALGVIAGERLGIPANKFFWFYGVQKALQSRNQKSEQFLEVPNEEIAGELLNRSELYALYDYGFWRQPEVSFEQWLTDRFKFKMSAFELSKILGKEDFGQKHEEWTNFAPRWNPIGLRPGYTQKQALTWLDAQSDTKRFLLVASRNSMKSTWARILALTLTVTYPDARILIVSETNKLSKKAMKEFRGYLEATRNNPTLFQQYFAEFTIAPDEGQSLVYDNPLAHLGLPQNSVESSSMESANTGSRFDFCLFDDPISRDNGTANEEQRAAAISKHGSIMKLREPAGYALNIQTPWIPDDLGEVMIKRNNEDPERPLAVRIDPVMEIRPEAAKTPLLQLKEEDVVLNFLPKLNWKFVRDEMRSPEGISFFRTQYMTEWVDEDDQLKVTFPMDQLQAAVRHSPPEGQRVLRVCSLDSAFSVAKTADFSCLITADLIRQKDQKGQERDVIFVHDVKLERMKTSELGVLVAETLNTLKPDRVIAERTGDWMSLQDAIRRAAMLRGIVLPEVFWKPVSNVAGASMSAKAARAKGMEPLVADGRLLFSSGIPTLENCLVQMNRYDGIKRSGSSAGSKDDFVDSLSLLVQTWGPRTIIEPKSEAQEEYEAHMDRLRLIQMTHAAIFGVPQFGSQQQQPQYAPSESPEPNKFFGELSKYGFIRK
jgi:hypothetical protein